MKSLPCHPHPQAHPHLHSHTPTPTPTPICTHTLTFRVEQHLTHSAHYLQPAGVVQAGHGGHARTRIIKIGAVCGYALCHIQQQLQAIRQIIPGCRPCKKVAGQKKRSQAKKNGCRPKRKVIGQAKRLQAKKKGCRPKRIVAGQK